MFDLVNLCALFLTTAVNAPDASSSSALALADIAVPSLCGLIGVIIGAILSNRNSKKQIRTQLLTEAYAGVFTAYTEYVKSRNKDTLLNFVAASERTMLLCSQEAESILLAMRYEMSDEKPNGQKCSDLLVKLREEAKKDIKANIKK